MKWAREVRVIGDEGEQIGVMAPFEALKMAREKNLTWWKFPPPRNLWFAASWTMGNFCIIRKREREAKKKQIDYYG